MFFSIFSSNVYLVKYPVTRRKMTFYIVGSKKVQSEGKVGSGPGQRDAVGRHDTTWLLIITHAECVLYVL